jgi:hypothetical protein
MESVAAEEDDSYMLLAEQCEQCRRKKIPSEIPSVREFAGDAAGRKRFGWRPRQESNLQPAA